MASEGAQSSLSRSPAECASWVRRIHEVHSQRSPEAWEAAKQKLEQARQTEMSLRKCKAVKSHAIRSRALATEGLKQMSSASSPEEYGRVQERWLSAQAASESRQQRSLQMLSPAAPCAPPNAPTPVLREAEAEEEEAMEEVVGLMGLEAGAEDAREMAALGSEGIGLGGFGGVGGFGDGFRPGAPVAGPPGSALPAPSSAVEAVLAQLKQEPEDEAESAAKFCLYEGYGREVEKMRGTLLTFYEESRPTVPAAVASDMDRQVKGIDTAESMGIFDDAREWFVYHMMRQAERNNVKMASMLDSFEKRLEFLASNTQPECPICLEAFQDSGPHASETLGCCHKVCKECWEHWSAVTHGRPFCPLCRNEEFLGAMAERVAAQP